MAKLKAWALERCRDLAILAAVPAYILMFIFLRPKDGDQ
jgi:hypothetical protein